MDTIDEWADPPHLPPRTGDAVRIDTHMHLYRTAAEGRSVVEDYPVTEYGTKPGVALSARAGTVEDGLVALRDAGASHGCVLNAFELPGNPFPPGGARHWPEAPPFPEFADELRAYDDWVCDVGAAHPELLPFVTLHPGVLTAEGSAAHVAGLADDRGARGVKLHTIGLRLHADDPALQPTLAVCAARRLPVVVHAGPDRHGAGWSRPGAFAPALRAHPGLPLVLAHLGGAAWRETAAVAEAFPHALFDLCEIVAWAGATGGARPELDGWGEAPTPEELVALIRAVGVDRVLFGSDFPWYDPADTVAEVEALPGLGAEERAAILGGNAARVLGLG
jgi:predicted TIM-barrel fold metal-dependent hydrolase